MRRDWDRAENRRLVPTWSALLCAGGHRGVTSSLGGSVDVLQHAESSRLYASVNRSSNEPGVFSSHKL